MSFSGKKFKKVDFNNVIELLELMKVDEKTRALLREPEAVSSFTNNGNGTWTYKVEVSDKVVVNQTFPLGQEADYVRPDGTVNKTTVQVEGNTLKQTLKDNEGRVIHFERVFDGDKMNMNIVVEGLDIKANVEYAAV